MHAKAHRIVIIMAVMAAVGAAYARSPAQPFNWVEQIGVVAGNPDQIRPVMNQVDPAERVAFTRRTLQAIDRLPVSPEVKAQRLTRAAVALVGASGESKRDVIGAVFAASPLPHLGAVSQVLSAGFDQRRNGLSDEAYLTVATNLMASVVEQVTRGGGTLEGRGLADEAQSEAIARLTVAVATFVRAAVAPAAVEAALMAYIPSSSRPMVAQVLPAAIKGDYAPLMNFVDLDARVGAPAAVAPDAEPFPLLITMDLRMRLADESRLMSVGSERLPTGYQNQGIL